MGLWDTFSRLISDLGPQEVQRECDILYDILEMWHQAGKEINFPSTFHSKMMLMAINKGDSNGSYDMVAFLLKCGCPDISLFQDCSTPVSYVIYYCDLDTVKSLLSRGFSIQPGFDEYYADLCRLDVLAYLIKEHNLRLFPCLLDRVPKFTGSDDRSRIVQESYRWSHGPEMAALLVDAIRCGCTHIVRYLLQYGVGTYAAMAAFSDVCPRPVLMANSGNPLFRWLWEIQSPQPAEFIIPSTASSYNLMAVAAREPWTLRRHYAFGLPARTIVLTVLMCAKRSSLFLPTELWLHVFEFFTRNDFVLSSVN